MVCYNCNSAKTVKNGKKASGKQTYKCKDCGAFLVENASFRYFSDNEKKLIERMYERGNGFRDIAYVIERSASAVFYFLKKNCKLMRTSMISE